MAKNIYHIHTSSNSYWDNSWTDQDYLLCETEEEYNKMLAECKQKVKDYNDNGQAAIWGAWRFKCSDEQPIHASEYYYGHEWQGKTFDAVGFTYVEHLERSNHYKHYLKPGSVGDIKPCTDHGIGWMYGSLT